MAPSRPGEPHADARAPGGVQAITSVARSADHERLPVVEDLRAAYHDEHPVDASAHVHGPAEARAAGVAWTKHGAAVAHERAAPVRDAKDADMGAVLSGRHGAAEAGAVPAHMLDVARDTYGHVLERDRAHD